jgi:hypothetical protein
MMGGNILIDSAESKGTTLHCTISYLPVSDEDKNIFNNGAVGEPVAPCPIANHVFENKVVLIVEPAIMKYMYYERLLASVGFTVHHAQNIQQWRNLISQATHLDVMMIDKSIFSADDDTNDLEIR